MTTENPYPIPSNAVVDAIEVVVDVYAERLKGLMAAEIDKIKEERES